MRVIAGSLKGRRLRSLEPGDLRIRPTADRAREALFSILQRWPQGGFLELFGGTGAVSVEAWSRGYAPVTCVESAPAAFPLLEANTRGTGISVLRKDVRGLAPDQFQGVAVLFADPPYEAAAALWLEIAPRLLGWLASGGVMVWETDAKTDLAPVPGWEEVEVRRYGAACFHFLTPV
ncbi:RsmD family RNA methyltransferase [Holophaga foetida]|uniref:RsmD family RNA methyltransferase n=1 Tax=Holophaga foetida TaxID=35839 RepID=UPI00024753A8|nr:RsmD family RNA methyltransferase [Holophaga foetida]